MALNSLKKELFSNFSNTPNNTSYRTPFINCVSNVSVKATYFTYETTSEIRPIFYISGINH